MARIFSIIFAFLLLGVVIQASLQKRDFYTEDSTFSSEGSSSQASVEISTEASSARSSGTTVGSSYAESSAESGATSRTELSDASAQGSIAVSSADSSATSVGESSQESVGESVGVTSTASQKYSTGVISAESVGESSKEVSEDSSAESVGVSFEVSVADSSDESSATSRAYSSAESSAVSSVKKEEQSVAASTIYSNAESTVVSTGTSTVESSAESTVYNNQASSATSVGTTSEESSAESIVYSNEASSAVSAGTTSAESSAESTLYENVVSSATSVGTSSAESSAESTIYSNEVSFATSVGTTSAESSAESTVYSNEASSAESEGTTTQDSSARSTFYSNKASTVESSAESTIYSNNIEGEEEATSSKYVKEIFSVELVGTESEHQDGSSKGFSVEKSSAESVGTSTILKVGVSNGYSVQESSAESTGTSTILKVGVSNGYSVQDSSAESTGTVSHLASASAKGYTSEESSAESVGTSHKVLKGVSVGYSNQESSAVSVGTTEAVVKGVSVAYTNVESSDVQVGTSSDIQEDASVGSSVFESSAKSEATSFADSSATSKASSRVESTGVSTQTTKAVSRGVSTLVSEAHSSATSEATSVDESSAESSEASTETSKFVSSAESSGESSQESSQESFGSTTFTSERFASENIKGVSGAVSSQESSTYSDADSIGSTAGTSTAESAQISYEYRISRESATTVEFIFEVKPDGFTNELFIELIEEVVDTPSVIRIKVSEVDDGFHALIYFVHEDPTVSIAAATALVKFLTGEGKRAFTLASLQIDKTTVQVKSFADLTENLCASLDPNGCSFQSGVCIDEDGDGNGYCNCYSGRVGNQCETEMPDYNPYAVDSSAAGFNATFDFVANDQVTFVLTVPSVPRPSDTVSHGLATFITFPKGSCNYPQEKRWVISLEKQDDGFSNDVFTATFTYNELLACGLEDKNNNGSFHIFSSSVKILRTFKLIKEIFKLDRTASNSFSYSILFPSKTSVQTSVEVVDNDLVQFLAVTDSSFDLIAEQWTIAFTSLTRAPYQLKVTQNNYTVEPVGYDRVLTSGSFVVSECLDTPANNDHCRQTISIKASGCQVLNFAVTLGFQIECRTPNSFEQNSKPCVEPAITSITPKFNVLTSSSCPLEKESPIKDQAMKSFKDDQFLVPETQFGKSNTIYFAVAFDSPAQIESVALESVCVQKSGDSSADCGLAFDDLNTNGVFPITVLESSISQRTDSPVRSAFSVNGRDIKINLDPYQFTSIVIKANYVVVYKGTFQKRSATFVGTANTALLIQLSGSKDNTVLTQKADNKYTPSSASATYSSILAIILAVACLIA